ncbi:MAG: DNA-binding response regulator [Deltaproteobacteria bacterium]|nr:MAG: DNA-binding response regulator [Deltaproteobacteria bacterium]RLC15306.1 MAG: DNA-binding response regulator [Deltaproteobacteria bacterium]
MTDNPIQTILVIDDDKDIVKTIKGNLELDGYAVLCAYDGRQGIDLVREHRPHLIILDLNLPDIDGIKACQYMRREFDFPIIMLTARDGLSDMVLGLECGADDYMVKPFNALELSARIKAVLKRTERSVVKSCFEGKCITIDFKSRQVQLHGQSVKLTKTEYELLELFVSYPAEVLSRDFIRTQIWRDSELYTHSRTVDVHVQRLRKKLEINPNDPRFIVTVAGVGYKFMADEEPED